MEFTLTERTEPFTLKEVLDFIDDTNISKKDAHELKSRIVDVVLDAEDRVVDEFAERILQGKLMEYIEGNADYETIEHIVNEMAEQMKKGV